MKINFKKIRIEHLGYTIHVKDVEKNPHKNYVMYVIKNNANSCTLFVNKKLEVHQFPTLAHEVIHILQYIAEARNIDLIYEQENTGYLMGYILNQLMGFKYEE